MVDLLGLRDSLIKRAASDNLADEEYDALCLWFARPSGWKQWTLLI